MSKSQNYISSELTHFVGRSLVSDDERYQLFVEIIKTGIIRTRNGNGRGAILSQTNLYADIRANEVFNPDMVCFCDIPTSDFEIHMKKYSRFGLSFNKDFLISQGLRPVFYIPSTAIVAKENISDIFEKNIRDIIGFGQQKKEMYYQINSFLNFHVFSFIKFFDPNKEENDPDNYYMEREWRGLERIEFSISDIVRIIIPSTYIRRFFLDVPEYNAHIMTI